MFGAHVEQQFRAAAVSAWPREMCGVITDSGFVEVTNVAGDPLTDFRMPETTWFDHSPVRGVVHSHPTERLEKVILGVRPHSPSAADMMGQIASAVPWAIVVTSRTTSIQPLWWGDHVLSEPLERRPFRHGITDCYAAVRAWYWQRRGIKLKDYARDPGWWGNGGNLYVDNFTDAGFRRISKEQASEGDVLLMQIGKTLVPNHAAINLGRGTIYHHPQPFPTFGRPPGESLSRVEPIGFRANFVTHVLRYGG